MMSVNVLVVESNRMTRTMYVAGLSGYGYRVTEVQTVRDAKNVLQSGFLPQVILLDTNLSDESGEALIQYVREDLGLFDTRIIVVSKDETAQGADVLLPKPVQLTDLLSVVRAA
jgi:CheY-like chemotaxis protein